MPFSKEELLAAPAGFAHSTSARFQDVDAAGIVFFARVFDWLHDTYAAFLGTHGHPLPEVIAARRWMAPLKHAEADYLRPVRFGDVLEVQVVRAHFEGSALTVGYRVVTVADRIAVAVGQTVHVWVDPTTFRRAEPPADLVVAFNRIGAA